MTPRHAPLTPLSYRLAASLATRLATVVPPSMSVHAEGSIVVVRTEDLRVADSGGSRIVDEDDDRTLAEKAECAALGVLSRIQDEISEHLTEPWPADGRRMADPGVRTAQGRMFLWYGGSESSSLFPLGSIDLDEVLSDR